MLRLGYSLRTALAITAMLLFGCSTTAKAPIVVGAMFANETFEVIAARFNEINPDSKILLSDAARIRRFSAYVDLTKPGEFVYVVGKEENFCVSHRAGNFYIDVKGSQACARANTGALRLRGRSSMSRPPRPSGVAWGRDQGIWVDPSVHTVLSGALSIIAPLAQPACYQNPACLQSRT